MKKITILVGCWVGQFVKDIAFFKYLENNLKCKIKKKSEFVFETIINDKKIIFQFCFGPDNDKIWQERKRIRAKDGLKLPPSINHLAKIGINTDEMYYIGFCGIFNGKKNQIYLPNKFIKISFDEYMLRHKHKRKIKVSKKINYPNYLIGKIKGIPCTTITSNQVLSLKYVKDKSEEILKSISKKLSKHADIVEMENYEIIKNFGKKHKIGIMLYGTDMPGKKKSMLGSKNVSHPNWSKFNKTGIEMIKKITQ